MLASAESTDVDDSHHGLCFTLTDYRAEHDARLLVQQHYKDGMVALALHRRSVPTELLQQVLSFIDDGTVTATEQQLHEQWLARNLQFLLRSIGLRS